MIKAIIFDLDDTLYPEIEYVKSGFRAIASELGDSKLYDILWRLFCVDRANVYQRAGFDEEECKKIINIYRNHIPVLKLSDNTKNTLKSLKENGYTLGIISDGRPEGQKNKIKALGLDEVMDHIIITDELGGSEFRKPNPKAFNIMKTKCGCDYHDMIYVGDNPAKDFYIGSIYPIITIRLFLRGIYSSKEYFNSIKETYQINDLCELPELIKTL